jgi:tRNA (adenine57-N1/adenine58-N1)-methyltransferase
MAPTDERPGDGTPPHVVAPGSRAPLGPGETVLLIDRKRRRSLLTLEAGRTWHSHSGSLEHDDVIGRPEGSAVRTNRNIELLVLRPTREDFTLKMKRAAQVVYTKDQAMIVALADIRPGLSVVEAGAGSGGLTLALLDAVGPTGRVDSFELRSEHAVVARRNVRAFHGEEPATWTLHEADVRVGLATLAPERVILDLVDPWTLVDEVAGALAPGGLVLSYLPSVPQVMRLTERLVADGRYAEVRTTETLVRSWDVDGLAVRPAHRMVAHTAFLTVARRVPTRDEGGPLPRPSRATGPGVTWLDPVADDAGSDADGVPDAGGGPELP